MTYTLCTSQAIVVKAGANVNTAASTSDAIVQQFATEAEGFINASTKFDWVTNIGDIETEFKGILADVCSAKAAISLIAYDMSGYTNRGYAESMINVNHDIVIRGLARLKEDLIRTKMGAIDS